MIQLDGAILDGKYRVGRQLGKGGMGAVYLATHLGTTRTVALKVIVPELADCDEFIVRFQREAEATGRLRHPNVVNVTDFGLTNINGDSLAYLVMEYLDGQTLGEYVTAHGRPKLNLVLDIVDQVALALDAAHAAGIVHRDLKPANIWMESDRRGGYNVKVLDFGIAKLSDPVGPGVSETSTSVSGTGSGQSPEKPAMDPENTPTLAFAPTQALSSTQLKTIAGSVLGTPAYMSPEQCRGGPLDYRADIYSLAVITYELVSGSRPFSADTVGELLTMQVAQAPPPPTRSNAAIPLQVATAVLQGLEKDPAQRPPSAGTFAALLRAGAEGELGVLRKARDLYRSYPGYFFPSFLLCFIPFLPLMFLALFTVRRAYHAKLAPDLALVIGMDVVFAALVLLWFQLVKAASALLLQEAIVNGSFRGATWQVMGRLARGLPEILRTQFVSLLDLRPSSFRDNLLWPVVWALEGRSGREAVARSRELCRTLPAICMNLMPQQYSPVLVSILMLPTMFVVIGQGAAGELMRRTLSGGGFSWLPLLYPCISVIFYSQFLNTSFAFLYWFAKLCRGTGAMPSFPTGLSREKRSTNPRPSVLAFWLVPVLMGAALLLAGLRGPRAALEGALFDGRSAAILKEIDDGASIETAIAGRMTPLLIAVDDGDAALAKALLDRGAKVNARNSSGATPLILAVLDNHANMLPILLAHGADIDAKNDDGRTALCVAALRGYQELVGFLVAHGADRGIIDTHGKTALDYAREENHAEIVGLLSAR